MTIWQPALTRSGSACSEQSTLTSSLLGQSSRLQPWGARNVTCPSRRETVLVDLVVHNLLGA